MVRKPQTRVAGEGSIYQEADGRWRVVVSYVDEDGVRRRPKRTAESRADAKAKLRTMLAERDAGALAAKTPPTVAEWLTYWLTEIAPARCVDSTLDGYGSAIRTWIIPSIGDIRLDRLKPEHLRRLYGEILAAGRSGSTARQVHAIMRRAMTVAQREGKVQQNVAALMDGPSLAGREAIEALTVQEAWRVLDASLSRGRNAARWTIALALGVRQGETLGLAWDDVQLDEKAGRGTIRVDWQLRRRRTAHGCGERTGGRWPCGRVQAAKCPQRPHDAGLYRRRPKSKKSRRTIPLPAQLVQQLADHRRSQAGERVELGSGWTGWTDSETGQRVDLVFTQKNGRALDPRRDYADWQALLTEADVDEARLHDARHTAATVLLVLGVDVRVVAEILGHSSTLLTQNTYQQAVPELLREATDRVNKALWGDRAAPGTSDGSSSVDEGRRRTPRPRRLRAV